MDRAGFVRGPYPRPVTRGRGPVVRAYTDTGALDRDCPNPKCAQPSGEYCVHDDGRYRRMPCPQRLPHNTDTGDDQ